MPWPVSRPLTRLNAFLEQRAALARQAAAILVFRARRANHGTDPPLAASKRPSASATASRRRSHRSWRPGLSRMPPVDRDRSRVDDMALDPVGEHQAINPKPVQSRFLNDDRFDLHAVALLGLRPRPRKKVERASAASTPDPMLGKLLAARTVDRHEPISICSIRARRTA